MNLKKKCINNFSLDSHIIIYTYVVSLNTKQQYEDNIRWIKEAIQNKLVSQLLHFNIRQSFFFGNKNRIQTTSPSFDINLNRILNVLMRPIFFKQVVGSQARILYSDQNGRKEIATAFNEAVGSKKLKVCTILHVKSERNRLIARKFCLKYYTCTKYAV